MLVDSIPRNSTLLKLDFAVVVTLGIAALGIIMTPRGSEISLKRWIHLSEYPNDFVWFFFVWFWSFQPKFARPIQTHMGPWALFLDRNLIIMRNLCVMCHNAHTLLLIHHPSYWTHPLDHFPVLTVWAAANPYLSLVPFCVCQQSDNRADVL